MTRTLPIAATLGLILTLCLSPPPATANDGRPGRPVVLLLGDSNISGWLGKLLASGLRDEGFRVVRRAKSGSGLAYPGYWDWLATAPRLAERHDADVVLLFVGGNDGQSIKPHPGDPWAPRIAWKQTASWRETYISRILELNQRLLRDKRQLVVFSPTNRRSRIDSRKAYRVRRTQQLALTGAPGVTWIDTYSLTSDRDGTYLAEGEDSFGRLVPFRRPDGIHLTQAGATALTGRIIPLLLNSALRRFPAGRRAGEQSRGM